jgi:hypothetical protein
MTYGCPSTDRYCSIPSTSTKMTILSILSFIAHFPSNIKKDPKIYTMTRGFTCLWLTPFTGTD